MTNNTRQLVGHLSGLRDLLNQYAKDLVSEYQEDLPAARVNAKGDKDLLASIDVRAEALRAATATQHEAVDVWQRAVQTMNTNPAQAMKLYEQARGLADKVAAVILNIPVPTPDTKEKKDDKAPKVDPPKGGPTPQPQPTPAPVPTPQPPAPDAKSDKDKGDKKTDDPKGKDPILAAIEALGADCKKNHTDALGAIEALKPGLIKPELAKILNGLTPEQLSGVLNRAGLNPRGVSILNILAAYTDEELTALLASAFQGSQRGDVMERLRRYFPRRDDQSGTPAHN
ncbi:MAG TPA: hypothetical protein VLG36_05685 [Candidatus Chromulinivoraceae bacterium]|nr:hypothetical protein [Candidatus Chromulinivoraceae bacterium]